MTKTLRFVAVPMFAIALLGLASSGCFRHNYGPTVTPPPGPANYTTWNHHLIFGLVAINNGHTSPGQVCGGSPAYVQNYVGIVGWLLGAITAGIYIPTTTRVWCSGPRGDAPNAGDRTAERPPATR